jgi:hypothetical protein
MEITSRCLPVGALPYNTIKGTTAMLAKLFKETPYIPILPNVSQTDTMKNRVFANIPGVVYDSEKLILKVGTQEHKDNIADFEKAFNNPNIKNLENYGFEAEFLEKYFQMIKKFKSKYAYINLLGPFTVSQILISTAKEQCLADKSYRKLFIHAICVKALWLIEKIKQINPNTTPIVILEEPMFGQFGMVKRENNEVTADLVINLFSKVTEKLKKAGAIVGVQCFEKCDWSIPIKAGVDLISYDAYNNPNNLSIIPEILIDFLRKGGIINWGIVPVVSDTMVRGLTIDYLEKRLSSTIAGIVLAGVPAELLYRNIMVSLNSDTDKLSILFAEKAILLATQLASRLAVRT